MQKRKVSSTFKREKISLEIQERIYLLADLFCEMPRIPIKRAAAATKAVSRFPQQIMCAGL